MAGNGRKLPHWQLRSLHNGCIHTLCHMRASSSPAPLQRLSWANLFAQCAEQISLAAVPLLAVLSFKAGAQEVGLLNAAQTLPFVLLAIPLGMWADRVSKAMMMRRAEMLRALALVLLWLAAWRSMVSLPVLAVLGFVGAVGTVAFSVAAPGLVQSLVAPELRPVANARIELARSLAFAAGPALGGALVAWAGASLTFALATALSLWAIALLWPLQDAAPAAPQAKRNAWQELREGWRFAWHQEWLKPMLLAACTWNVSWFVMHAAFVPYAIHHLGLNASQVGWSLGLFGVGMMLGSLLAPRIAKRLSTGQAIALGPACSVLAAFLMAGSQLVASSLAAWAMVCAAFFIFGAGPIVWTIMTTTLRQSIVPPAMLGRVTAIFLTMNAGARPLGALLGAAVGALLTQRAAGTAESVCLWLAAAGFVLQFLIIAKSPVAKLQTMPLAQAVA
jgi:predicted MFS family arabinose efflux permease